MILLYHSSCCNSKMSSLFAACAVLLLLCWVSTAAALASLVPSSQTYSLVTWNLLAPLFATKEKYRYCDPAYLDWSYRRNAIVAKLQSVNADIICLQEVQIDTWEEDLLPHFHPQYSGILQNVTRGHPVACGVLVRNDKFRIVDTESRSRALILVLQEVADYNTTNSSVIATSSGNSSSSVNNNKALLFLANVHLEAGHNEDETRFCQLKSLLKRLRNHVTEMQQQSLTATTEPPCILLAGDFNMLYSNPVYRLLSTGVWDPAATGLRQTRASRGTIHRTSSSTDITVAPQEQQQQRPQFPLLPLRELNEDSKPNTTSPNMTPKTTTKLEMTFAGGSVLDYIWASWTGASAWVVDERVLTRSRASWPSNANPSDHLPIGARFRLGDLEM